MSEVSQNQMALCNSQDFLQRVAYNAALMAMGVRIESPATANHIARDLLAQHVIANPLAWAGGLLPVMVGLTNVRAAGITDGVS